MVSRIVPRDGFVAIEAKVHAAYFDGDNALMIGTTSGVTVMDVSQIHHSAEHSDATVEALRDEPNGVLSTPQQAALGVLSGYG